jgi:ammonium transporter Rh
VSGWPPIPLNMTILLNALYIAATVVVSYGALVGRVSFGQAYAIAFFEVFFATANFKIMEELRVNDYGGTMFVHLFGATFGLFASLCIKTAPVAFTTNSNRARDVTVFGLLGTILMFLLYPVFNTGNLGAVVSRNMNNVGVPALTALNFRGYFNTVAAMASSVASSYMLSRANSDNGNRFTIWQIQTSAIAGGAAIAATAPMLRNPWGALMTGSIVGVLATISQTLVAPLVSHRGDGDGGGGGLATSRGLTLSSRSACVSLSRCAQLAKIKMYDTTGVFSSHWVPGFVGVFASAIAVARVTDSEDFTATQIASLVLDGRTATAQGGTQCAFGLITFVIALIGGVFTG